MGVFDVGPLDGDEAANVMEEWEERRVRENLSPQETVSRFLRDWGDDVDAGSVDVDLEIMALVGVCWRENVPVPAELQKAAICAVNRGLEDAELREWTEPERRREALLEMLHKLGGVRASMSKKAKDFNHPQIVYKNSETALVELERLAAASRKYSWLVISDVGSSKVSSGFGWTMSPDEREWLAAHFPQFMNDVFHMILKGVDEASSRISDQSFLERRAMLAGYVGMLLRFTEEEMRAILERSLFPNREKENRPPPAS